MRHRLRRMGLALLGASALGLTGCQGSPAEIPPPTASPTPAPATTTAATEGAGELANATIAMPFLAATVGTGARTHAPLKYTDGQHEGQTPHSWFATIDATARVDVDQDGTDEVIAKAECSVSDATTYQVFARRPDGQGGWATLGTVGLVEYPNAAGIRNVGDVAVTSTGDIRLQVTNTLRCGSRQVAGSGQARSEGGW